MTTIKRISVLSLVTISLGFLCMVPPSIAGAGEVSSTSGVGINPDVPCCGGGGDLYWGVDSTDDFVTGSPTLLSQVETSLGTPQIIGRYLNNGGTLLTRSEANSLIGDGIPLVLYYSPPNVSLTSAATANSEAAQAESEASSVGASSHTGVAIYRDVEGPGYGYTINQTYINQWYSDLSSAGYVAGFYEDSYAGPFENAFSLSSAAAQANTYLQTAVFQSGTSYLKASAPASYNPYYVPACESLSQMTGWQYLDGDSNPHVDVDEYALAGTYQ